NNFFDYLPNPAAYATVSGTVWNDANSNGTNDVAETGVANVAIDLFQDANTNGAVDVGEPLVASALTAADGSYSFLSIIPGRYVIRETDLASYVSTGDTQPPNNNRIALNLGAAANSTNNDFFDYFVGAGGSNRPPVAFNDGATTSKNTSVSVPVLVNDVDPDGDVLTIIGVSPTNGTASIVGTNIVFTPSTNFSGVATAGYTISDGNGGTNSALITISVTNRPPVATNDFAGTPRNTGVAVAVLVNDFDPD